MGNVGVVAGILDHAGHRPAGLGVLVGQGEGGSGPARQAHGHRIEKAAADKRAAGGLRRRGGAGAGGPAAAQWAVLARHGALYRQAIGRRHPQKAML